MASRLFLRTKDNQRCHLTDEEHRFIMKSGRTAFGTRDELEQFLRAMPGKSTAAFVSFAAGVQTTAVSPA